MSETSSGNEIRPRACVGLSRDLPQTPEREARIRLIEKVSAACDGRTISVKDVLTSFRVPVPVFLEHVPTNSLIALQSTLATIATRLAGGAGRTEEAVFVERLGELCDEIVDEIENRFGDKA